MNGTGTNLTWFIRRLHRRLLLLRLAESGALGLGAGCAMVVLLSPVLIYRGQSTMALAATVLPLSALTGLVWRIMRWPTPLQAALEADRQLELADLLSTAWILHTSKAADPFEQAVLVEAHVRCGGISPRQVLLGRLGMRAWSGIGLATALVGALTLLSSNPVDLRATEPPRISLRENGTDPTAPQAGRTAARWPAGRFPAVVPDDPDGEDRGADSIGPLVQERTRDKGDSHSASDTANPEGSGGGAARSRTGNPGTAMADSSSGTSREREGGDASGGAGASSRTSDGRHGASGSATANASASAVTPAWRSSNWSQAGDAAELQIRSGRIPPAYHDLIRAYFDRR